MEPIREGGQEPLLLACDVDGTLVGPSRVVSDATRAAIAAVQARGTTVVLASGRMPSALLELCRTLRLDGPQITMQGAHIASPLSGDVVSSWTLGAAEVSAHLEFARQRGVPVLLYYPDRITSEAFSQEIADLTVVFDEPIPDVVGDLRAWVDSRPVKTFFVTGLERHDEIAADARAAFGDRATITWGDERSVELLPHGVSKGAALRLLADTLGVDLARVAAVGDGHNDIAMFEAAGSSVAVSRAAPDVRAAATMALPAADDAFPLVIERLFPSLRGRAPSAGSGSPETTVALDQA
jgi:Cof subfamily protein (haloacid dehalogenase superfamily)